MIKLRGTSLRFKDFADVNFQIGITGNVSLSDSDKIETALLGATLADTKAVMVGSIIRYEDDQYVNKVLTVDKSAMVATRKMILSFEDAGALVVKGKYPTDSADLVAMQTAFINKTITGEKITKAVLSI